MRTSRSTRQLAIGAVAIFSLACGSDSITAATSVNGTYSLRTINGAALPVTLTDSLNGIPFQLTFMSPSSITLNADHSVRIIATARWVFGSVDEVQADTTTATYALSGKQVTFSQPGSTSWTAEWNGSDMLTTVDNGVTFTFRK